MPTALARVQVLCPPELIADLKTLAKHNRRSMSALCGEILAHALRSGKYRDQLEEAQIRVPVKPDPRTRRPQAQFRADAAKAVLDGADIEDPRMQKILMAMKILMEDDDE